MIEWKCPGVDYRFIPDEIYEQDFSILSEKERLDYAIMRWREIENTEKIMLPFVLNFEAALLGCGIKKQNKSWFVGDYCCDSLEDLDKVTFDMLSHKEVQVMLAWMKEHPNEKVIVEMSGPFSVLSGLADPMVLYGAMISSPEHLEELLAKVTKMQIAYRDALIDAGCKILSMADPAGVIHFVGEDLYKKFTGKYFVELLKNDTTKEKQSLMALCGKTSQSLLNAGFASIEQHPVDCEKDYHDILFELSKNSEVSIIGQQCIQQHKMINSYVNVMHL